MDVADERDKAYDAARRLGEAIPANPYRPPLFREAIWKPAPQPPQDDSRVQLTAEQPT